MDQRGYRAASLASRFSPSTTSEKRRVSDLLGNWNRYGPA